MWLIYDCLGVVCDINVVMNVVAECDREVRKEERTGRERDRQRKREQSLSLLYHNFASCPKLHSIFIWRILLMT